MSQVMLATKARSVNLETLTAADWHFSVKLDGFRGPLKPGRLLSRNGTDLGDRFPEIVERSPAGWVLDGEVVLAGGLGVPTVYEVQRRWSHRTHRAGQARLAVFDVLRSPHDGDVTAWPLRDRLQLLDQVRYDATLVRMPEGPDGPALFRIAVAHGAEGIVAKRMRSRYRPGRSSSWLKFKRCDRITCLATRWIPTGDQPSGAAIARPGTEACSRPERSGSVSQRWSGGGSASCLLGTVRCCSTSTAKRLLPMVTSASRCTPASVTTHGGRLW